MSNEVGSQVEIQSRGTRRYVAVVGSANASESDTATAEEVGLGLADAGAVVVCGGLGGVMEAVCRGAKRADGTTVGILPGSERLSANEFVDVSIATGLGEARNAVVVSCADSVIAVGGEFGTLSEIALALRAGKPVIGLDTWELARGGRFIDGVIQAEDAEQAVALAVSLARAH